MNYYLYMIAMTFMNCSCIRQIITMVISSSKDVPIGSKIVNTLRGVSIAPTWQWRRHTGCRGHVPPSYKKVTPCQFGEDNFCRVYICQKIMPQERSMSIQCPPPTSFAPAAGTADNRVHRPGIERDNTESCDTN